MNKIINIKKKFVPKKNKICPTLLTLSSSIVLNKLYLNINFEGDKEAKKQIQQKLSSYYMQDKKKNKYDEKNIILYDQLIEKMVCSKMKCYYCRYSLLLFYSTMDPG